MRDSYLDDMVLIDRYRQGDRTALEQLFGRHRKRAFQYAHSLTRSHEEAGDVVSEAFLRVCKSLGRFEGKSAFTTWLYRILTNCYFDLRKKRPTNPLTSLDAYMATAESEVKRQIQDPAPSPHEYAEREEVSEVLGEAAQELPEIHYVLVVLYHKEMMSYKEMAQVLELPVGTIKSRLNRARLSLRTLLADQEQLFSVA